jgi:hypothetical protein
VIQEAGSWAPCTQVFRPVAGACVAGRCTRAETPRTHLHNTGGALTGPALITERSVGRAGAVVEGRIHQ